jgi:hypothetical protein
MVTARSRTFFFTFLFFILNAVCGFSQSIQNGFNYQTVARDASGIAILMQPVSFRFSFYSISASGTLVFQEDQLINTDNQGLAHAIIGTGVSSGAGTLPSFNQINWSIGNFYLKVSIDVTGGTSYTDMGTTQLFSVPYALYSSKTLSIDNLSLSQLVEVNLSGINLNKVLKWNGNFWIPANDNDADTVLFSYSALSANNTDTALYTFGTLIADTILFANQSDSSLFATNSITATNSNSAIHSDTAMYVFSSPSTAWELTGNAVLGTSSYIGTFDNKDVVFRTNNLKAATLKSNGSFTIGNSLANGSINLLGIDGLFAAGTYGSSYTPVAGAGTKMLWYPSKGAFRAGTVDAIQWDTTNLGSNSSAFGFDTKSNIASLSSGSECEAADYSVAIGRKCKALAAGAYPGGSSVALGDSCISGDKRAITIGKNNFASSLGGTDIAIGLGNKSTGGATLSIGAYCVASGQKATALGYRANSFHIGGLVFSDASSYTMTTTTANFQFMTRAAGGIVFYTDSLNTMGVTVNAGSGSWSIISDKNKKENFSDLNYESVLCSIDKLKIKTWNYSSQNNGVRHIGPMAQDFYELFHVGESNVAISSVDMDGVILAGIKGISNRLITLQNINQMESLKIRIENIDNSDELNKRLNAIETSLNRNENLKTSR